VRYPGLPSHPDHATAKRAMKGFGGVVTYELACDLEGAYRYTDASEIPYNAPSLGGVESLIEVPALMSFWDRTPEERAALGIKDALIRLSVGIEDADDLIADLEQALSRI
jgi:cystathionine gamma-synthase